METNNQTNQTIKIEYLTEHRVSEMTGFSLSKLRSDRFLNRGIPYSKDRKAVRYSHQDVVSYMEKRKIKTELY